MNTKEQLKNKLFTIEDMETAFEAGEAAAIHRIVQERQNYMTFDKFIQSLLPKNEQGVEITTEVNLK